MPMSAISSSSKSMPANLSAEAWKPESANATCMWMAVRIDSRIPSPYSQRRAIS
jgi:hypothetical protein